MSSIVYFTRECTPQAVVRLYQTLGRTLPGNLAVKVHSGEEGNRNYLPPEFWQPVYELTGGTVVECNTAYDGARNYTRKHRKLLESHGWSVFPFDLMDAEGPDLVLDIPRGVRIRKNYVGKNLKNYDSMLVLAHYKGHPMGGYGGALKQISIGVASSAGKCWIHSAGKTLDQRIIWNEGVYGPQDAFLESMADAASSVVDFFRGNMIFVNVMKNMSVDCDCIAEAEPPCLPDMGMMISLDPVAIDRACIDMVRKSSDPGKEKLLERITSRNGEHTIEAAAALGVGSTEYELVSID